MKTFGLKSLVGSLAIYLLLGLFMVMIHHGDLRKSVPDLAAVACGGGIALFFLCKTIRLSDNEIIIRSLLNPFVKTTKISFDSIKEIYINRFKWLTIIVSLNDGQEITSAINLSKREVRLLINALRAKNLIANSNYVD